MCRERCRSRVGPVAADMAEVGKLSFDVRSLHVVDQMSARPKALLTNPEQVSPLIGWYTIDIQTCRHASMKT